MNDRRDGLDTVADATIVDDASTRTVHVGEDDASGGITTVIVPDDDPAVASGPSNYRRTLILLLGIACAAIAIVSITLALFVRMMLLGRPSEPAALAPPAGSSAVRASASCSYRADAPGEGTLTIACDVTNASTEVVRTVVVPVVHRGEIAERVHHQEITLGPGERVLRRYELRGRPPADAAGRCSCEATPAP